MSEIRTISCDRCGASVPMGQRSMNGTWHRIENQSDGVAGEVCDLCPACAEAFDRFMEREYTCSMQAGDYCTLRALTAAERAVVDAAVEWVGCDYINPPVCGPCGLRIHEAVRALKEAGGEGE